MRLGLDFWEEVDPTPRVPSSKLASIGPALASKEGAAQSTRLIGELWMQWRVTRPRSKWMLPKTPKSLILLGRNEVDGWGLPYAWTQLVGEAAISKYMPKHGNSVSHRGCQGVMQ